MHRAPVTYVYSAIRGAPVPHIQYPQEQMHRIAYTKLTERQISQKLIPAAAGPASASPPSDVLAGKSLKIVTDNGPVVEYRFDEIQKLRWRYEGERAWSEERYESWESAPGVMLMSTPAFAG